MKTKDTNSNSDNSAVHVLVVDDEPFLREAIAGYFEAQGFSVGQAASGREALSYIADQPVDVLVSDVRMADGSGIDILLAFKANQVKRPHGVIMMTGFGNVSEQELYGLGADRLVNKPLRAQDLITMVKDLYQPQS